jgi:superfamily II DNA or RNA helicase
MAVKVYTPRAYQTEDLKKVRLSLATYRSTVYVLPTGGGKTYVFNGLIKGSHKKGRTQLVLAHREALVKQSAITLREAYGVDAGVIMAGIRPDRRARTQVASIATLIKRGPQALPFIPDVIVIDEAHHAVANTYLQVLKWFPRAYVCGVTATPWRLDGIGLGAVFKHAVYGPSVKELERQGFLMPAKAVITPLDIGSLTRAVGLTRKGEFRLKQLGEYMAEGHLVDEAAAAWASVASKRKTLLFACDQNHAKALSKAIGIRGGNPAILISGMSVRSRRAALQGFENGYYDVLINCMIATEGTDIPACDCVMILRPTMSLALYLQMCGRGSRPNVATSKKDYLLVDAAGVVGIHGMPSQEHPWTLDDHEKGVLRDFEVCVREVKDQRLSREQKWVSGDKLTPDKGQMLLAIDSRSVPKKEVLRNEKRLDAYIIKARRNNYKRMWVVHKYLQVTAGATDAELRMLVTRLERVSLNVNWSLVRRISKDKYPKKSNKKKPRVPTK